MQNNIKNLKLRLLIILLMCCVGVGLILYDFYIANLVKMNKDTKICHIFTWHLMNYMLGIFSGSVLGNFLP